MAMPDARQLGPLIGVSRLDLFGLANERHKVFPHQWRRKHHSRRLRYNPPHHRLRQGAADAFHEAFAARRDELTPRNVVTPDMIAYLDVREGLERSARETGLIARWFR